MSDHLTKEILNNAFQDKPAGVLSAVDEALTERMSGALEDLRKQIASTFLNLHNNAE